jgi:hypothetical protein
MGVIVIQISRSDTIQNVRELYSRGHLRMDNGVEEETSWTVIERPKRIQSLNTDWTTNDL